MHKRIKRSLVTVAALASTVLLGACGAHVAASGTRHTSTTTSNSGNTGSSSSNSLSAWFQNAQGDLKSLENDFNLLQSVTNNTGSTGNSGNSGNSAENVVSGATSACQQIQTDVTSLKNDGPIPNASLQDQWSTILADYESGANDCVDGASSDNLNLVVQAGAEFRAGTSSFQTLDNDFVNHNY